MLNQIVDTLLPSLPAAEKAEVLEKARQKRDADLRDQRIRRTREERLGKPFCVVPHEFETVWEGTYRRCKNCPYREAHFGCWNSHTWEPRIPDSVYQYHPDMDRGLTIPASQLRQNGSIPANVLNTRIQLVGAGGIGSFTAFVLAKMGFTQIGIHDQDRVARENIGTQMYLRTEVENPNQGYNTKSTRTRDRIVNWHPDGNQYNIYAYNHVTNATRFEGVVISAVDNMAARKLVWENVLRDRAHVPWLIDGRMGGEYAVIYIINPNDEADIAMYERSLFPDEEAFEDPCVARATVFTGMLIAGWIGKGLRDALAGKPNYPRITRWDIQNNEQLVYTKADSQKPRSVAQSG